MDGGSDDAAAETAHAHLMLQQPRTGFVLRGLFSCYMGPLSPECTGTSIAKVNRAGRNLRTPGPVAQRIEQQPSKLKVAGSIPAGVAKKSTHKSRYSKSFRQRIECRAE
jgi:hypothetical protein